MARFARVVVPGIPHHVVQRGNRKQIVFFSDFDRSLYLDLLLKNVRKSGLEIWVYCLMTNHVHMVAVPSTPSSLAEGIGRTHKEYTRIVNKREGWKGYLWQGRFFSCPMDEAYLYLAVRYIECNPVRAGITGSAEEYPWSSARAHVLCLKDSLLSRFALHQRCEDWSLFLKTDLSAASLVKLRRHLCTGRPLGDDTFLAEVGKITGRSLIKGRPGPRPGR